MRLLFLLASFFLFFTEGLAQVRFTFFNKKFVPVKERKADYFTNQYFEGKGLETVVLTPLEEGEKWLVTFQEGKFKAKKPYTSEETTPFIKEFDGEGTLYHDKNIFLEVDVPPGLAGGEATLQAFFAQNLKYPPEAQRAGIQGRVFVQFVVTAQGEVTDIRVVKGIHPLLNAEAVRMVVELAKQERWIPAKIADVPVSAIVIMPFLFKS